MKFNQEIFARELLLRKLTERIVDDAKKELAIWSDLDYTSDAAWREAIKDSIDELINRISNEILNDR